MARKAPGAGSSVGPMAIQFGLDPRSFDRSIKMLDKYKGAELAKREDAAAKRAANLALGPIRNDTPVGATGELLAKTKVRKLKLRGGAKVGPLGTFGGEVAAYAAGSTSNVAHLVIRGHKIIGHRPNKVDTGKRARANAYVDRAIAPIEHELESFIAEQVERLA
jgi:hypothetical protein